jgi:hypothetical protein
MKLPSNTVFGCILASWTDGLFVHPDMTFQGDNGGGFATIPAGQYDVHPARGAVVCRPYDTTGGAVNWSAYTAYRATYSLLNPSSIAATYSSAVVTTEAQTVQEQDFGFAPFDPVTAQLNMTTRPANQYLVGDFLSLGDVGTRPKDANTGTGIWGDKSGLYGLSAATQEVVFSASTGKITAGAGVVTLDKDGITLTGGNGAVNSLKVKDGANTILTQYAYLNGTTTEALLQAAGKNSSNRESILTLSAVTDDGLAHAGTGAVSIILDTELDGGSVHISDIVYAEGGLIATGSFTSPGIDDNADATAITIDSSERVGIGSTSPDVKLDIEGNSAVAIRLTDTNVANASWDIRAQTGNTTKLFRVIDVSASADRMTIDSSGRVGIGSTAPSTTLDVEGNTGVGIRLTDLAVANATWEFRPQTSNTTKLLRVIDVSASADRMTISSTGVVTMLGEAEIDGALNHDGSTAGFYGTAPVVQRSAYTQTYSTATRTHVINTAVAIIDGTGGTANDTLQSISSSYSQNEVRNNFADLAANMNAMLNDLIEVKKLVNSLIDDQQALGFVG